MYNLYSSDSTLAHRRTDFQARRIYCRCSTATDCWIKKNRSTPLCAVMMHSGVSQWPGLGSPTGHRLWLIPHPRLLSVYSLAMKVISGGMSVAVGRLRSCSGCFGKRTKHAVSPCQLLRRVFESFIGVLPPREGLQLYKARVDPHLTSGCEIVLHTDLSLVGELETPQKPFLRRLLDLSPRCMLSVFMETGILPFSIGVLFLL
ncbi:hypothetical protein R3P38DRAFT_583593 [Favolaschia claudopus]|uniref:Uncharacterized protein n=1 Tax=Favolaschia claudopus TaxID=2862362 RepID=A0AAV9Z9J3_9AGAR